MALEAGRSNIHILGRDEETGGAVTYMHTCVHTHTVQRRRIPHLRALAERSGCAVTLKGKKKKTPHTRTLDEMQKSTVVAILPAGLFNIVNCL